MVEYDKNYLVIGIAKLVLAISLLLPLPLTNYLFAADIRVSQVDEYIDAYVKLKKFSGSVLIAKDNEILVNKGYGMANYEHDVPNMPYTKFRIGSVTKQFTAMAIMMLQERGLLNLDDTLDQYVPDFMNGDKITIHHLLTHTSGIETIDKFPSFMGSGMLPWLPENSIELIKAEALEFEPGSEFRYSNSGYILLGHIIEKVSGESYPEFVGENIFDVLGMKNSDYDHYDPVLKHRAAGYDLTDNGLINGKYLVINNHYAAGALYSTVEDLYIWDRALYTEKLVSKRSVEKMSSAYYEASFKDITANYGYGFFVDELFGHRHVFHTGTNIGFRAQISRFPDDDATILLLSNIYTPHIVQISRGLAAILFGEEYELPSKRMRKKIVLDPKYYDDFVGTYYREYRRSPGFSIVVLEKGGRVLNRVVPRYRIKITKENGSLFLETGGEDLIAGRHKAELFPESETTFFRKIVDEQISFVRNRAGKVYQLIIHSDGGREIVCQKIE